MIVHFFHTTVPSWAIGNSGSGGRGLESFKIALHCATKSILDLRKPRISSSIFSFLDIPLPYCVGYSLMSYNRTGLWFWCCPFYSLFCLDILFEAL